MKLYRGLDELPAGFFAGAMAIGNFDGVHQGHAQIIARLNERARQFCGPAVVFTFDPHPVRLLRPDVAPPPLTWLNRKAQLLERLEVDVLIAYSTDKGLLSLEPHEYFERVVCERLQARAVVEGPNFFFGKDRSGNVDVLRQLCQLHDVAVDIVEPVRQGDNVVSSSRVREAIFSGEISKANQMLTQPYRIRGMVVHGARRGGQIGFPTANVGAIDTLLPKPGVYAGRADVDGTPWPAAINVGPNPTFGEGVLKVEVHLVGYSGNLYGEPLEVDFLSRLRDIHTFGSVTELQQQLDRDVEMTRQTCSRDES